MPLGSQNRHLSAHIARVQAEQEAAAASEREAVEAQLVGLTLTDDVPIDQPNKLWTPRNQFQQDVNHTIHLPDHSIYLLRFHFYAYHTWTDLTFSLQTLNVIMTSL